MSAEAARAAALLAHLASPPRLLAFAELARRGLKGATVSELAVALDLPVPKVGNICARLVSAGLAAGSGNGVYRARPESLREASAALDARQPIAGLLEDYPQLRSNFAHGRVVTFPPTLSDRYEQLSELLARFLALDGLVDEDTVNDRLATVTDDVAGARRMLVDTGWLERDRAGTTYGLARPLPVRS